MALPCVFINLCMSPKAMERPNGVPCCECVYVSVWIPFMPDVTSVGAGRKPTSAVPASAVVPVFGGLFFCLLACRASGNSDHNCFVSWSSLPFRCHDRPSSPQLLYCFSVSLVYAMCQLPWFLRVLTRSVVPLVHARCQLPWFVGCCDKLVRAAVDADRTT